ncbi:sulfur carrier protein ThiS [Halomonas elongata]|uniref:Sulfur carrier protein ThiS n=2 Tax=Halomonas elongata TaxID=2746 RepID=E1VBL2_HALED|nr:sulfur carrier protein ThiS [Halomonas elongata]MBW5800142.1 sulfur carrier protein ThiS [Halomonas elongata]MDL4861792.1 sulfur carrier protein ThiS [Halomonas elongata]OBX35510.1 sulfur carrier protein ThiS [Halomonas elongata]RAW07232.1 thiamine biosynthesis protein ThiS [Halomonas elongata]WBF17935.1 sulfur carrier protein ThiS [Halomonas elongata]
MQIHLNGEAKHLDSEISVAQLVETLGLTGRRIAVEVNEEIVPKSVHGDTRLADGDRVEIVHAIGGG